MLYEATTIVLFPIALIWGIFTIVKNTHSEHKLMFHILHTEELLSKHLETTISLYKTLQDSNTELKSSFKLKEFNILISDTNEILSDIIKRSNSISSTQMEHLWSRTAGGEKWLIAKAFIETYNFQSGFAHHLLQKAKKDSLLKGSILEFQTRYICLLNLLKQYDKSKLFYNMIEYGALGKVFNLINPIAGELLKNTENSESSQHSEMTNLPEHPVIEESLDFPSFFNTEASQNTSVEHYPMISQTNIETSLKAIHDELLSETPTLSTNSEIPYAQHLTEKSNNSSTTSSSSKKTFYKKESKPIITVDEIEKEINASPENNYDEYISPFGAWKNDK